MNEPRTEVNAVSSEQTEYKGYKKEMAPAIRVSDQVCDLVSVLDVTDRMLGLTERTFAQHPRFREAAEIVRNHPDRVRSWKEAGLRTRWEAGGRTVQENVTEDMIIQENARIEAAKQEMLQFLRKNHGNIFTILERQVMSRSKDKAAVRAEVDDLVVRLVADVNGVKGSLRPQTSLIREQVMTEVTDFLLHSSQNYSDLRRELEEGEGINVEDHLLDRFRDVAIDTALRHETAKSSEANRIFAVRRWLVDTGRASFEGVPNGDSDTLKPLKIFLTPFYKALVSRAEFLGRKDNGLGGVIYVGPPGTGKTELAIEVNRIQGYDTRLVQIHHYTTFNELIGEKVVQVGIDKSTNYLQRMMAAKNWFEQDKNKALESLKRYYETSVKEGKETATSFGDFMSQYVAGKDVDLKNDMALVDGFVQYLDTQIAGAALGKEAGDQYQDWVNGEILIAIAQGKRVVLDELDKAGRYSMGGILTLLAKSPGEKVSFGNNTIELPHWFKIDATANRLVKGKEQKQQEGGEVLEYLYDRFNVMEVGYPPVKDMLMINAVRLSDREGNVMLSKVEQWQMVGITTYLLPRLRELGVRSEDVGPVSHRLMKDFCSMLVDPLTRRRTSTELEKALITSLLENRVIGGGSGGVGEVTKLVQSYLSLYQKETHEPQPRKRVRTKDSPSWHAVLDKALTEIMTSPMLRAIANYDLEEGYAEQEETVELIDLPEDVNMQTLLENKQSSAQSQVGFEIIPKTDKDRGTSFVLAGEVSAIEMQPFLRTQLQQSLRTDVRVLQTSADARVALIEATVDGDPALRQHIIRLWGDNPSYFDMGSYGSGVDILIAPQSSYVVLRDKSSGNVQIVPSSVAANPGKAGELIYLPSDIKSRSLELSSDGKYLKISSPDANTLNENTIIFNVARLIRLASQTAENSTVKSAGSILPDIRLRGGNFTFVTSDMLVNTNTRQAAIIKPKAELGVW